MEDYEFMTRRGGGGMANDDSMTKGGGGASPKGILHDEGGRGVQTPPKKHDVINEQPLSQIV